MNARTISNLMGAAAASFTLTLIVGGIYLFYPLIVAWLGLWLAPDSHGIGSVSSGVSRASLNGVVVLGLILFVFIFYLLQRRPATNSQIDKGR